MKTKKLSKKIIVIISCAAAIILIIGIALVVRFSVKKPKVDDSTYVVRKENFENTIEISGNISAAESQTLQAAGDGTIQKVNVKKGDFVKKGKVLIELDAVEQRYALAKHEYEMEQVRISGSRRDYELMQTQKTVLEQRIMDRMVYAYFDGIVVDLNVSEGDVVEAKDKVGTMINRDYMTAEVEIVENDVYKLKVGQKVNFTFPAYEDLKVEGYVESFPAVGRITSRGATVVDATVRIDNPPKEILPNFSFTGKIEVTPPQDILIVERGAIGYKGGSAFVEKVKTNGDSQKVDVKVMPYGSKFVQVLEGVEEKDVLKSQGTGIKSGKNKNGRPGNGPQGGMPPR